MNDFQGLLSGDYGFKPQGKSAPMAPRSSPNTSNPVFDFDIPGSSSTTAAVKMAPYSKPSDSSVFLDDHDSFSRSSSSVSSRKKSDFDNLGVLDSIFNGPGDSGSRFSSLPVFDKPVYDDEHDSFDDLLGGLGRKEPESKGLGGSGRKNDKDIPAFDDLLPGFGARTAPSNRNPLDSSWDKQPTGRGEAETTTDGDDPFVVLKTSSYSGPSSQALYDDPLEQFSTLGSSSSKKVENVASTKGLFGDIDTFGGSSSKKSENTHAGGGLFNDIDPLGGLGNSVPLNDKEKIGSPDRAGRTVVGQTSASVEARERSFSIGSPQRNFEEKMAPEEYHESANFDTYSAPVDSRTAQNTFSAPCVNATDDTTSQRHKSTVYDSKLDSSDDVWLTVSEVPLYTQPTAAPPPSRPPPPKPARILKAGHGSNIPSYAKKKIDDHSAFPTSAQVFQTPKSHPAGGTSSFASQVDELEDFAKGRSWNDADGNSDALSGDCLERHSDAAASAAAMKEAMDRAEAKFKHAKEARERENAKAGRMQQEQEDRKVSDFQEREFRERPERERQLREDEERKQREEEERMRREREAKQKEQRRIERERIERERVKQAVERATREARERAAADARARAEKAAVKAQTEARERAERNVVFKAQAEARERAGRAAAEAKQRADREKAEREARSKAEREAKEKEARDKAAPSAVRANQQKNENDLESFFGMGSRASSAPRPRAGSSVDPFFDTQFPKKQSDSVRTSVGSTTSIRKTPSSTNIVDDLSSIFGGAPSAGQFQEFEGETEERRIARLQRHQRTQERAAKALAEKNQRDLDVQKEQAERHRIGETFDIEIKRWAAGKEGNLRALLSTLQYVLWPECGWQAVSLTDLITAAAVKKAYRKATLCIHPDKVQQKGANLQQKYVAEKVFDLLKEAWNKFNSEELF